MSEVAIVSSRASVMIYDDQSKKWVPSGNTQGLSKVQIYHHTTNNTFRVVGRKLQDHEVVINCAILKGLKYNQATPTFHQWRDNRQVYGLNFASREEADNFSQAMLTALDALMTPATPAPPPPQPAVYAQSVVNHPHPAAINSSHGPPDIDGIHREDHQTHRRQMSGGGGMYEPTPASMGPPKPQAAPPAPPTPATPAAPAAPPAPPAPAAPPAPPAPPPPPSGGAPPPAAPPPPPASVGGPSCANTGGLAAALQGAKLRRTDKVEESLPMPMPSPGPSDTGTIGRSSSTGGAGGMGDMMSEMQKKLAARRAKAENAGQDSDPQSAGPPPPAEVRRPWEKQSTPSPAQVNGSQSQSPKLVRKRNPSLTGQEAVGPVNGGGDLESLKQEILTEMRREMGRMKVEIIDAIRQELGHR
ncbi:vasodilator-stimulated phosphoprotein-like isoform X2 [Littorina saxatilis]|uniref:vasodilator-stimulated phosphoprotein-like isoform X2 n=1 Tax=Littorina saxatilis TaxID=31220 RepID=UPI0038B57752